jgi:3-hydroxyisobutyrate dehydrogenase
MTLEEATRRRTVAVVGTGAMGSRLARNLLADGYPVIVSNRSPQPVEPLVAAGALEATHPADAAARADVVIVAVADDDAASAVWLHPQTGILAGATPHTLVIEASTLSPGRSRELAAAADRAQLEYLEAPMIGSLRQVEGRALVHLVGGPAERLDAAQDVLHVSAARVHHVGDHGTAMSLKLVVNALLAVQVATIAELLAILDRAGVDLAGAMEVLTPLPVTSPVAARAVDVIAARDYSPNFPVRLVAKDLRYLTALAEELGADAPMASAALAGYQQASAAGHGDEDLHAIGAIR